MQDLTRKHSNLRLWFRDCFPPVFSFSFLVSPDSSVLEPETEVRGAEEAERSKMLSPRRRSSDGESVRRSPAIRPILSAELAVEVVGVME